MSEFKPGDVALARWNRDSVIATATGEGGRVVAWHFVSPAGSSYFRKSDDPNFTVIRRLAVIDPEDDEQVERLRILYYDAMRSLPSSSPTLNQDSLRAALREYTSPTPPKPDEPMGLGAVVEDAVGALWTRTANTGSGPWFHAHDSGGNWSSYAHFAAVRVLAEGVQ